MRRSRSAAAVLLLVGLLFVPAGCSDEECAASCTGWEESDVTRLTGTYLEPVDDSRRLLRFDTVERGELEIEVFGNTAALDQGDVYRIPYLGDPDDSAIQASLPRDCGCGPTMTHADGSTIATGFWQVTFGWWPSWTAILVVALAVTVPLFAFAFFTRERSPDLG